MKFAGKNLDYYTGIITIPFVILVAWSLAEFVAGMMDPMNIFSAPIKYGGGAVALLVCGWTGWSAARNYQATVGQGAWAGALLGAAAGFAGAIIYLILFLMEPGMIDAVMSQMKPEQLTADKREMIEKFVWVFVMIGLISGLFGSALIGAVLGAVGAAIARNTKKEIPPASEEQAGDE